jgi:hypothetical protein
MRFRRSLLAAAAAGSLALTVSAHNLDVEPQALSPMPWLHPEGDSSIDRPHFLEFGVMDSQAIFAYLDADDVDVFAFAVTPADLAFGPVVVAASALPPACNQTKNNYPVTALLAPMGTSPGLIPGTIADVPFAVPPGYGVLLAPNPPIGEDEERPIFVLPAEGGLDLGLSWFLPQGLTQQCLFQAPWTCDYTNTINTIVWAPGVYYLAVWDPDGVKQDYTANIGFLEDSYQPNPMLEAWVQGNGHLHGPCRPPYPGD